MAIYFFEEEVRFHLPQKIKIKKWLKHLAREEGFHINNLNIIFCSDEFLYRINFDYLSHQTYTDIITFDNSESKYNLEGDIFISIERIRDNAAIHQVDVLTETRRVISHGLFHLCGFKDKSAEDKKKIRAKEDQALHLFQTI